MKATTRRGTAVGLPVKTMTKKKKGAARSLMCGCGGSKSVAIVSRAAVATTPSPPTTSNSTATALSSVKSVPAAKAASTATAPDAHRDADQEQGTPSVDTLLRQLRELERGVRALGVRDREDGGVAQGGAQACCKGPATHRRSASDWGYAAAAAAGHGRRRLEEESVAVVTESADPLGDFRLSMTQMVVENGITGGAELRELLQRFLSLNSARHHHLILRAFADVWEDLFAGGGGRQPLPRRPQKSPPYLNSKTVSS